MKDKNSQLFLAQNSMTSMIMTNHLPRKSNGQCIMIMFLDNAVKHSEQMGTLGSPKRQNTNRLIFRIPRY